MPLQTDPPRQPRVVAKLSELVEDEPARALVAEVDLVIVRHGGGVHALHAMCPHRRAHMADGHMEGDTLVCQSHGWEFDVCTGESGTLPGESLMVFSVWIDREADTVTVDEAAIADWKTATLDPFKPGEYLGH